jgi:flagellar hook assembly protein FlgD
MRDRVNLLGTAPKKNLIKIERSAPVISGLTATPTSLKFTGSNSVKVDYNLSESAKVTIGIYDSTGQNLIRAVQPAASRKAGANSVVWNGKNTAGTVVTPGT